MDTQAKQIVDSLVGRRCIRVDKNGNRISDLLLILCADATPWKGGYSVTVDLRSPDGKPPKMNGIARSRVRVEGLDLDVREVVYPPSPKVFRSARERQPTDVPVVVPAPTKHPVVCQKWEESERGWGCRSDGYTLHLTEGNRKTYVERFMEQQCKDCGPEAPDEYTRPCGTPYVVDVDDVTYQKLLEVQAKHGIDGFSVDPQPGVAHPEGQPGPDGWKQG